MNSHPSSTIYGRVENGVTTLSKALTLVSGILLIAAILLTCISIVGRGLIPIGLSSVPGDYELVEMLCGLAVFAFMPYCQLHKGHISVDLFITSFGHKAMAWTQLFGDIIITGLVCLLVWRHSAGTFDKYDYGDTSFILEIPIWWSYAIAQLLLFITVVTSLFTVWRDIRELSTGATVDALQNEDYHT
jgi:TRAP-type C4-dicarboxylate transport system permease small subunit